MTAGAVEAEGGAVGSIAAVRAARSPRRARFIERTGVRVAVAVIAVIW